MKERLKNQTTKARVKAMENGAQIGLILKAYQGLAIAIILLALTQ